IDWQLPEGFTAGEIQWPVPEKNKLEDINTYVFENEVALLVPISIPANAVAGTQTLKAKVSWLECEVSCIPGKADVAAALTVGPNSQSSPDAPRIETW